MSSPAISIRAAVPQDATLLSAFGAAQFAATFAPDNRPEDMRDYLATAFTAERTHAELQDPDVRAWIAESGATPVVTCGYAVLRLHAPHPAVPGDSAEVVRLYVDRAWHGRGIAATLMARCVEAAGDAGARTLWLGVWERNARAIAFYGKQGFARVGEQSFLLGSDRQLDWVMARPLARAAGAPA